MVADKDGGESESEKYACPVGRQGLNFFGFRVGVFFSFSIRYIPVLLTKNASIACYDRNSLSRKHQNCFFFF